MTTVVPPALRKGDTIAIVAPSARINHIFPLRIERARAFLESQGFKIREIYSKEIPSSFREQVRARVDELHEAFGDKNVRAIICAIGGLTANEILPHLDYDLIRANPKIFIGSSDITLLHHAFLTAGLRTYYGPSAITQFGEYPAPLDFTRSHFLRMVSPRTAGLEPLPRSAEYTDEFLDFGGEPSNLRPRNMTPSSGWKWLRRGRAEGRIRGGCLPSMLQLFGTRWQLSYKGAILLLELPEGMLPNESWPRDFLRWNLADLATRGVWDDINGLVLGRPYKHSADDTAHWEAEVLRQTEGYEFPILAGVDVGHTDPMLTLPLDTLCRLDSEADEWQLLEPGVGETR